MTEEADSAGQALRAAMDEAEKAAHNAGLLSIGDLIHCEVTNSAEAGLRISDLGAVRLMGIAEVAELLEVTKQRASELARSPRFPAPLAKLLAGPVWDSPDIDTFLQGWDRKPGQPHASTQVETRLPL